MIFTKMQLNGNDFIFVNCLNTKIINPMNVSRETCVRRFGIGADGLVLISMSDIADYKVDIYNSDGSRADICGNALLLLGKFLYESEDLKLKIKDKIDNITVETDSGVINVSLSLNDQEVISSTIDVGKPSFDVSFQNKLKSIKINKKDYDINYISLGNLHGVIILDEIDDIDFKTLIKENSRLLELQKECNIEFIKIIDESKIKIKIFERGVGETFSCGSGAAACVAVAIKNSLFEKDREIKVISKGGKHIVKYLFDGNIVITGKPELVYNGYLKI